MTARTAQEVARLRGAYERHQGALLSYARPRTASLDDAEEVVASTFATAWRRIDRLPPEPFTRSWLYRVAWKTLANQRRADERRRLLADRLARAECAPATDPGEDDGRLHEALSRLRYGEREVLRLVAWEDLSHAEAAAVLGCSPNAFAIRLHRARAALRRELERQEAAIAGAAKAPQGAEAPRGEPRREPVCCEGGAGGVARR